MAKTMGTPKKRETDAQSAARLLLKHYAWEREVYEQETGRFERIESAIVQLNHFTEHVESLDLQAWKSKVDTDLGWIKWLMGGTTVAAIGQLILSLFRAP